MLCRKCCTCTTSSTHTEQGRTIMAKTVSVRISGKKGKITVEPAEGATYADVVREAAETLGLEGYDPAGAKLMVDGNEVSPDDAVQDGAKVDAAPAARLG